MKWVKLLENLNTNTEFRSPINEGPSFLDTFPNDEKVSGFHDEKLSGFYDFRTIWKRSGMVMTIWTT